MSAAEIEEKLKLSPLLTGAALPYNSLKMIKYSQGKVLADDLHGTSAIGLVVSGVVEVFSVALDGKDIQLNTLSKGDCFGICNLYVETELDTVLFAAEETEILYIPKSVLLECLEKDPALSARYATICNQKLQFLLKRIELLTMQSCRGRVAAFLLDKQNEKGEVKIKGSREDLARHLGVSRASLFRELSALQVLGAIKLEGSSNITLCKGKLEKLI